MVLEGTIRERLDRASREMETAIGAASKIEKLSELQDGIVKKVELSAEALQTISEACGGALQQMRELRSTLEQSAEVLRGSDARPILKESEERLAQLVSAVNALQEQAARDVEKTNTKLASGAAEVSARLESATKGVQRAFWVSVVTLFVVTVLAALQLMGY